MTSHAPQVRIGTQAKLSQAKSEALMLIRELQRSTYTACYRTDVLPTSEQIGSSELAQLYACYPRYSSLVN